jgi:hypothetical protein
MTDVAVDACTASPMKQLRGGNFSGVWNYRSKPKRFHKTRREPAPFLFLKELLIVRVLELPYTKYWNPKRYGV